MILKKSYKRQQLRKIERNNVVKNLHATSAYGWRREKANEFMTFGNLEPAHLYNILRKAKQLDNDEKLELAKISEPITSVFN